MFQMFNQITNCNNPNEKNQNCVLLKLSDFHYLYYNYAQ